MTERSFESKIPMYTLIQGEIEEIRKDLLYQKKRADDFGKMYEDKLNSEILWRKKYELLYNELRKLFDKGST
jgi:hypothetical protein